MEQEQQRVYTVGELTGEISALFNELWPMIWVEGEVSNFSASARNHYYWTLKDADAAIRVAAFRNANMRWRQKPVDGEKIIVFGRLSVYAPRGEYQLIAETFIPAGAGSLAARFEALKEKLLAEGLFAEERKKQLPLLPDKVGVVTSPHGAAIQDIINVLGRRFAPVNVLIYPAQVQGEQAAKQIAAGVSYLCAREDVDVIIVGRGGGSAEDLWAFNEEVVVRAIADCVTPVISAVGHETDFSLSDFAADRRAATPTEAAELVVANLTDLAANVDALSARLMNTLPVVIEDYLNELKFIERVLELPLHQLDNLEQNLDDLDLRLTTAAETKLVGLESNWRELGGRLANLNPASVLERGYAIVTDDAGRVVTDAGKLAPGDLAKIKLFHGKIDSEVKQVYEDKE
jgi:exodeoxyribonuclease VII large subunit